MSLAPVRSYLVLAVLACAVVVGLGASAASATTEAPGAAKLQSVRIDIAAGALLYLPIWIAQDEGFFQQHGLNVSIITNPQQIRPVLSGDSDVTFASPNQVINADGAGADLQMFMTIQDHIGQALVVKKGFPMSCQPGDFPCVVQALKGQKLGETFGGGAVDSNLRYELTAGGLNPDNDVTIIATGGLPQMLAGLQNGQLTAIQSLEPITSEAVSSGIGTVVLDLGKGQGPPLLNQPWTVGVARKSYIDSHISVIRAIEASMVEAEQFMGTPAHFNEAIALEAKDIFPDGTPYSVLQANLVSMNALQKRFSYTAEDFNRVMQFVTAINQPPAGPVTFQQAVSKVQPTLKKSTVKKTVLVKVTAKHNTLRKIAQWKLKSASKWTVLYAENRRWFVSHHVSKAKAANYRLPRGLGVLVTLG
jgi:NitT/TauT family transport system substrate-binding protein